MSRPKRRMEDLDRTGWRRPLPFEVCDFAKRRSLENSTTRFAIANLADIKNRMSAPAASTRTGWRRPLPFEVCDFAKRRSLKNSTTRFAIANLADIKNRMSAPAAE